MQNWKQSVFSSQLNIFNPIMISTLLLFSSSIVFFSFMTPFSTFVLSRTILFSKLPISLKIMTLGTNLSVRRKSSFIYAGLTTLSLGSTPSIRFLSCLRSTCFPTLVCFLVRFFFLSIISVTFALIASSISSPISVSSFIQGCDMIQAILSRQVGSNASIEFIKLLNALEYLFFFSYTLQNFQKQFMAMYWQLPVCGVAVMNGPLPVTKIKRVTPAAKRSFINPLQFFLINISGDLNKSDPQIVFGLNEPQTLTERPKSQIFKLKLWSNRMFQGLISLWIIF